MVYTRLHEPHTLEKTLEWTSPHMFIVLGILFCAEIIIDGWSKLAFMSPTHSEKHYHGPAHTCSQCLALFFVLKSLLTDGLHSPSGAQMLE